MLYSFNETSYDTFKYFNISCLTIKNIVLHFHTNIFMIKLQKKIFFFILNIQYKIICFSSLSTNSLCLKFIIVIGAEAACLRNRCFSTPFWDRCDLHGACKTECEKAWGPRLMRYYCKPAKNPTGEACFCEFKIQGCKCRF